jgi:branched-chain amino acid transport system substrate-binding protein
MKRMGLVLLVAGVLALVGLVNGAAAEEGVTATEIHIGQWGPQTGPAAA